ncbi:MAG: 16S rRNA (cytosine(967)-C(5))-methyltransferase RsmB [Firmicutes bacterium]|nr:16S rRNA (cytosine(967)-C(5))-methyltransferase RsmB [Bacillota bacterium]
MDADRKTAYATLMDVEMKDAYSNLALNHNIAQGKPANPAFVRELVYGVLENKRYLDHILGRYMKTPFRKLRASDQTVLRMGLYQLLYMDSVPEYAAVNESVVLARKYCRGRENFVNGVLRSFLRDAENPVDLPDRETDPSGYFSIRYSYEPWIIDMWLESYEPAELEELLKASNQSPQVAIRPNLLKISKEDLKAKLEADGYEMEEGHMAKDALLLKRGGNLLGEAFAEGLFRVQDESSMLAVEKLDPKPGEFVLDMCAAPGGKSLYMAERMKNQGRILSGDIYDKKLEQLRQMAGSSGITIIETRSWDAAQLDESLVGKADRVMIDVPCSGLGVIRKKPEIKYKKFTEDMSVLPKKQFDILTASSRYVKSGGVMVYSTCTIAKRENEQVVRAFLRKNPEFEEVESIQLLPHIHKTNGFYICKLRRK